jgi:hypothetical protein
VAAKDPLIIANAGGFWGDRQDALRAQVTAGPVDVVMIDYLAERPRRSRHRCSMTLGADAFLQTRQRRGRRTDQQVRSLVIAPFSEHRRRIVDVANLFVMSVGDEDLGSLGSATRSRPPL